MVGEIHCIMSRVFEFVQIGKQKCGENLWEGFYPTNHECEAAIFCNSHICSIA